MKMEKKRIWVLALVLSVLLSAVPMETVHAAVGRKLVPTENVHSFDLGSDNVGGTGVEGNSNWIKIVQNSNKMKLYEDIPMGTDVAAVQVTFAISEWSGVEFPITWGCNLNFLGDGKSTWCGTAMFEGISTYVIDREGKFTVTCDLAALCKANDKEGIEWLQTCEMVVGNLTEGDKTVIEILDAVMYLPGETVPEDNATRTVAVPKADTIIIDPMNMSRTNGGVFEGWGTSLCWYGNRIGASEQASSQAAELLYNEDEGLGLNIIRYNVGGGDDPSHNHIQRSDSDMPGYWTDYDAATDNFTYDFTKDANQHNVLLKSIEQCPEMLVEMFSNSAPYFMTRSGCTSGTTDEIKSNISTDKMAPFADYMATVVKHYVEEGINVVSVEPMNEPSNGWNVSHYGVKQEGCSVAAGEEQSLLLREMYRAMEEQGLANIALAGCDETNDTTTNQSLKKLSAEAMEVVEQINTHTYSRNETSSQKLYKTALDLGKKLWMTETDNGDVAGDNAGEMGAALNFAYQITADLNNLRPSAWIMWQAIGSYSDKNNPFDPDNMDRKALDTNGFWGVCYADMNEEIIVKTKKYYAFGQYTKYIRPGDTLIATEDSSTIAAYSEDNGQIKIVTYNASAEDRDVCFDLSFFDVPGNVVSVVRTSGDYDNGENWAPLESLEVENGKLNATVLGNSITTFVVDGASHDIAKVLETLSLQTEEPQENEEVQVVELIPGRPIPAVDSVTGRICFASSDWNYTVMTEDATAKTGMSVSTLEDGSYSLTLPAPEGDSPVKGTVVFCIDLVEYAKQLTGIDVTALKKEEDIADYRQKLAHSVRATITSIEQDGQTLDMDAAKIVVDDTEANGNLRLEVYNMYGPTAEDSAIDPDAIEFSESLVIHFDIELAPTESPTMEQEEVTVENAETDTTHKGVVLWVGLIIAVVIAVVICVAIIVQKKQRSDK